MTASPDESDFVTGSSLIPFGRHLSSMTNPWEPRPKIFFACRAGLLFPVEFPATAKLARAAVPAVPGTGESPREMGVAKLARWKGRREF
jgi:hypothetical protein